MQSASFIREWQTNLRLSWVAIAWFSMALAGCGPDSFVGQVVDYGKANQQSHVAFEL